MVNQNERWLDQLVYLGQNYRVTSQVGKNLLLTELRQFWQLVGRYCSHLLPRQDGGTFQISKSTGGFTNLTCHPVEQPTAQAFWVWVTTV